jgi:hypothetical protein
VRNGELNFEFELEITSIQNKMTHKVLSLTLGLHTKPISMSVIKVNLLSQILNIVDRQVFKKAVKKFDSDKYNKGIAYPFSVHLL